MPGMTRQRILLLLGFGFIIPWVGGFLSSITAQCDRSRDSMALVDLYQLSNGSEWTKKNNWLFSGNPLGTWYGIKTNPQGCVIEITLNSNKLKGPLTDSIVNLSELVKLNLSDNQLTVGGNTDSLPKGWSKMTKLELVNLSGNIFGGPVIAEFGNVPNLQVLNLSLNYFTKNLPSQLGNSTSLRQILLNQNDISGPIPPSIGQMANLEECILSQNLLTGALPPELGNLSKLRVFSITQNQLTGSIPPTFGNLTNAMFLYMNENQLDGNIPATIGQLSNLRELWLNNNQLSGNIPPQIEQLSLLRKLILNDNMLTGNLPTILTSLTSLIALHVSNNQISGDIPAEITNLINLESLHLDNNLLSGTIPEDIGKLQKLTSFRLHDNMITGMLPESLANIPFLKRIYVQNNLITGCFPQLYKKFCPLKLNLNVNANGYNFLGNDGLIFNGDFEFWCTSNYKIDGTFTSNAPICEGNILRLLANAMNLNYSWSGPNGFVSSLQNPIIPDFQGNNLGLYQLTVTDFNGCTASSTFEIDNLITGSISANTPICEGKTIELHASPGVSYSWTGPNNFSSVLQKPNIPGAGKIHEGKYTVQIQTSDCVITKQIDITLTTIGQVTSADTACLGDNLQLQASGGQIYSWTGPSAFTSNLAQPVITNLTVAKEGIYTVEIKDSEGCQSKYSVTIKALLPDTLILDDVGIVCAESEPALLNQQKEISGRWSGKGVMSENDQYYFNPAGLSGDISLFFQPDTSYHCLTASPISVRIPVLDIYGKNITPNTSSGDDNGAFDIGFLGEGNNLNIEWMGPSSGNQNVDVPDMVRLQGIPSGLYSIAIYDENGCFARNTVNVPNVYYEVHIPNVVSKNASKSENSVFTIYGNNISSFDMEIYDRWGNKVFVTKDAQPNDVNTGWHVADTRMQNGVYVIFLLAQTPAGPIQKIESLTVID